MFPASKTLYPASLRILYISKAVVVLPFVPVIATIFAFVNLEANSISEIILISFSIIF